MSFDWSSYAPDDRAVLCFLRDSRKGTVLLIEKKRGLGAGKINAPGGKLEGSETALDAAVRETTEEVGLSPHDPADKGTLRFAFTDGYNLEVTIFTGTRWSGTMVETDEAVPFWIDERSIPYHRMWEDDQHWLPHVLDGQVVDGYMVFDGDVMVQWDIRFSHGVHITGNVASAQRAKTKQRSLN